MSDKRKILLPILVLLIGAVAATVIVRARPKVERQDAAVPPPLVRVVEARVAAATLSVRSQGTVAPFTESTLVSEVPGTIEWVAPAFSDGGLFRRGELLVRIDPRDYEVAVTRAEAQLAQARVLVQREEAEADVARQEWAELGDGDPSPLTTREPQLAEARAGEQAAEAALEQARLNLERTRVRAPFDGRVRSKLADRGQYVGRGTRLAEVYSTDVAEVRLPVPKSELAFLELDLNNPLATDGPAVELSTELGRERLTWPARVVRTGGEFDQRTRMLDLFARVDDPLGRRAADATPLPMGLFVDAEIAGLTVGDAVTLPRSALRDGDRVLVVDDGERLRFRDVEVLRRGHDQVVIIGGLASGELICVSPLETVVDGMRVRTLVEGEPPRTPEALEERL